MWSRSKIAVLLILGCLALLHAPAGAEEADGNQKDKPSSTLLGYPILYVPSDHISKGSAYIGHRVIAEITSPRSMRLGLELRERFRVSVGYGFETKLKLFDYGMTTTSIGYESNSAIDGFLRDPIRRNPITNTYFVTSWGSFGKYLSVGLDYLNRPDGSNVLKPYISIDYQVHLADKEEDIIQRSSFVGELRGFNASSTGRQLYPSLALGARIIGGSGQDLSVIEIGTTGIFTRVGYSGGIYFGFGGVWAWRIFEILGHMAPGAAGGF